MKKILQCLILLAPVLLYASDIVDYPFEGVKHIHRTLTEPRNININIVEIELSAEGIGFAVTPSNGESPGDADACTTTSFMQSAGCQIAVNAGFYNMITNDVLGYVCARGYAYSPFMDLSSESWPQPYAALNISPYNQPDMIFPADDQPLGTASTPVHQPWNAVPGSEWIVREGAAIVDDSWPVNTGLHPRTAGGYNQDKSILYLVTVDGRQNGFSEGMTVQEVAQLLVDLGVYQGINFDGGGSTTMAFADPAPRVVNSPSGGSQRSVANHLGVYANYDDDIEQYYIFSGFENSSEGTFTYSPGYSGSTQGIISSYSTAYPNTSRFWSGQWSEKLVIAEDPAVSSVSENPQGGWFVRWVSGASASPSENVSRPAEGYIGFWARTSYEGLQVSMCIDNDSQMERGVPVEMQPDGYWHCYQWSLEDDSKWEGWYNGDGSVSEDTFTIDSIQLLGPNTNAVVYIDDISHDAAGSLERYENCEQIWKSGRGMAPDYNQDCVIDSQDLEVFARNWLECSSVYDLVSTSSGRVDMIDLGYFSKFWLSSNDPEK
ncbi:Exopolysaccharide biosynthesis protein related to N-acetylglucosamine-1-phosphodiester alpha-N-acetylglucosaminidase [Sedimentisphaera cyanobacteriorum]|uniref:Exopolysaccharide biosynthesis protein related to N-acetylglucosamine-1-phosphodiester alpha-N-acetylglucosaminidase n=1 Tax=Sedimentisphaera cyanobacteriorum TaxID=1940790 RepID=A0A1Q2HS54_9BACT|nr:phosphodiester glycosidase family protein [Sedimentisphaera cyanobacteriorum]AQQ10262.1 Exopolysaccharide biosynthesis protein related to N-acetylglucosamine-1-phosphodiester alpha-N-acetylglucosaminidase [Sedimentisphaera cyanobacteriorum]